MSSSHAAGSSQNCQTDDLRHKAEEMTAAARQMAEENLDQLRATAADYLEQGKARALDMEKTIEQKVREQPVKSLLIAAGCGLLLGVLFSRR